MIAHRSLALLMLAALLLGLSACTDTASSPSEDALDERIQTIVEQYPEATVAVAVRDPQTGTTLNRNADRLFHAASTMKVPVMIEVFRQAALGRFAMDDSLLVKK